MREQLIALHELQKVDSQVLEIERSAETIPQKIAHLEKGMDKLRSELGTQNNELEQLKREQAELETVVGEESNKHKHWKRRLNDIKSTREYQALSREIENGERQVRELEEKLLELSSQVESKEKETQERGAELKIEEQEVRSTIEGLKRAQEQVQADADKARLGREKVLEKVPPRVLKRYETLRKRLGGVAIAVVRSNACSGCNMRIRPQQEVELLRATSWETCPNCHRILVHETQIEPDKAQDS